MTRSDSHTKKTTLDSKINSREVLLMCYTENPKEDNNNISKIHIQYSLMNILFDKKGTRYKKDDVKEYNNKNNAEASRQTIAIPLAANFTSAY